MTRGEGEMEGKKKEESYDASGGEGPILVGPIPKLSPESAEIEEMKKRFFSFKLEGYEENSIRRWNDGNTHTSFGNDGYFASRCTCTSLLLCSCRTRPETTTVPIVT